MLVAIVAMVACGKKEAKSETSANTEPSEVSKSSTDDVIESGDNDEEFGYGYESDDLESIYEQAWEEVEEEYGAAAKAAKGSYDAAAKAAKGSYDAALDAANDMMKAYGL